MSVLVTRVNLNAGLVELWVNIDDGRKHIYEQMTEDIQNPERGFNGAEGKRGDFCLVCISDVWHRARIVSKENGNYNVFLIDQGQKHLTTDRSLAWGKTDSFVLPPEIESCILANVLVAENEQERAERFLKSFPGKTMEALVQDLLPRDRIIVLDVPAVSLEMCEAGLATKIPADEFENLMRKCQENDVNSSRVQYLYPALLTNTHEYVTVTEATHPHHLCCRLLIFSRALEMLSDEIQQHYEESSHSAEAGPRASGEPCAARGSDGRWKRSVLRESVAAAAGGLVEVTHVDQGKTELVPVDHVKPLHEKFLAMPVVTYPCRLDGVKESGGGWTTAQMDYLRSLILHQNLLATFSHPVTSGDVYGVTLYANDAACVNSCFVEKAPPGPGDAIPPLFLHPNVKTTTRVQQTLPNTKTQMTNGRKDAVFSNGAKNGSDGRLHRSRGSAGFLSEEPTGGDSAFAVGSRLGVKVTCVENPLQFWCQTAETSASLRRLMQNLQSHYAFAHPQPIVESICVARDPDDGMWYRARIMAGPRSPVVGVRFIDYGHVQKVPLRDVRPIDPAFLRLSAQAFQCSVLGGRSPGDGPDSALAGLQESRRLVRSPEVELRCVVKAVTLDEEGLPLNVVDIETPPDGAGTPPALKCAREEERIAPGDAYNHSTHGVEVGGRETVSVTSCSNINHFYCNLEKNSQLLSKVNENIRQFVAQGRCGRRLPGPDSVCVAKYPNNQWYRGRVVETSPQIKVHFVDYGDTLVVKEADILAFPDGAAFARSAPVLAVLLGLAGVPQDAPQEVNLWFAHRAVDRTFTASVVARGGDGRLAVELFDGTVSVNAAVREMLERTGGAAPNKRQHDGSGPASQSGRSFLPQEVGSVCGEGGCEEDRPDGEVSDVFIQEDQAPFKAQHKEKVDVILGRSCSPLEPEVKQPSLQTSSEGNLKYKWPDFSPEQTREVFASCIVGPLYFWCQFAATQELTSISRLAQEAGQSLGDLAFSTPLDPGSLCLALFPDDDQWYRAQVMHRNDNELHVVFIDYGNEAGVDVKNVRPLTGALLERPPQAFLCSLDGFEESQGSWDDGVYDFFFNLLVDEPLRVTVFNIQDHRETAFPQYSVQIECEKTNVYEAVKKYWSPFGKKLALQEDPVTENVLQRSQSLSTGNGNTHRDVNQNISKAQTEVFASCIVEPSFFWCQYANTEDLDEITKLCQEAGRSPLDTNFLTTLVPGSLCLALFSSDNQWYRAQVMDGQDGSLHMVFLDYGNEADVDVKDVRSLPQALLDVAPQALLCSLGGFDDSRGSWDDAVYDDFYNLLVNKPLKLSVLKIEKHLETALPQHQVEIECEGENINEMMKKYWMPLSKQGIPEESPDADTFTQDGQTDSSQTHSSDSKEKTKAVTYKQPNFSRNKKENVYASCIVGPCFFWCQYAENLGEISQLCQEAGRTRPDGSEEAAAPGFPCLALFSGDGQWYRAQVMERRDTKVHVVFMDYGNEADVEVKCLRPLPPGLLGSSPPQAFLCCLDGLDEPKDCWRDDVCDDFYSLLVDKLLRVTVIDAKTHPEIEVPQYSVQVEFKDAMIGKWLDVNTLMEMRARQKNLPRCTSPAG